MLSFVEELFYAVCEIEVNTSIVALLNAAVDVVLAAFFPNHPSVYTAREK